MSEIIHLRLEELEKGLDEIRLSPKNEGRLSMIVRRPDVDQREELEVGELTQAEGLVGDNWRKRSRTQAADRLPNPDVQLTLINARLIALVAQSKERWQLAGDQLVVDLDLSVENLPSGTRLALGSAMIEVSAKPHTGCDKFTARFGQEARLWVNSPPGKSLRLRGLNARVIQGGMIRVGDVVRKVIYSKRGGSMIEIHVPASLEFNTANANLLTAELKKLHSIDGVLEWNIKATLEVEALHSILKTIEGKQEKVSQVLILEQQEHKAKPLFSKLLDFRKEQKRWLAEQSRLAREKAHIEALIEQFESAIAFTPDDLDDLEVLTKECKQQRQELHAEKKVVNDQMSSIRVEAKQQAANTNYGNYGKGDRRRIRLNKESALRPQESRKAAIERQLKDLDQIISWLDGFSKKT